MKTAVYTCVTGRYDRVRDPAVTEEDCEYFLISDDASYDGKVWRWIDVDLVVPDPSMSARDKNRYCKLHPHILFSEYDHSIYLDGSIQIVKPFAHNIDRVGTTGIAAHRHRTGDCVYTESIFLSWLKAVDREALLSDMARYVREGFPRHFGLFECGVLVSDLGNPICAEMYENWYQEYTESAAKRDQQALMVVLWRMGLMAEAIGNLGGSYNVYTNPEIDWDRGAHYKP